jgi:hypothetical protein
MAMLLFLGASLPVGFLDLLKDAPITAGMLGIIRDDGFQFSRYPTLAVTSPEKPRTAATGH